jgi:transposase
MLSQCWGMRGRKLMQKIAVIGLDIAKDSFHVHAIAKNGDVVSSRKLKRSEVEPYFRKLPKCTIGMESCATAHHWGRVLQTARHNVKLMPPSFVKPYVKSQKNDAKDAEAICEAVQRPTMRFVPIKSREQQAIIAIHAARELLVRQQTMLINACRACLAEFGLVAKMGSTGFSELLTGLKKASTKNVPPSARIAVKCLAEQLNAARAQIRLLDAEIRSWQRNNADCKRLATIPGVGVVTSTALVAHVVDPHQFKSGRGLAVSLGLVPMQFTSGGKTRLGHITKRGNARIRTLLILGARNVLWAVKRGSPSPYAGLRELMARKPFWVAAVALANRIARVVWALLVKQQSFRPAKPA